MRLSHARRVISVRFDDSNLVSRVGLAAVLALAARCGLGGLVTDRVRIAAKGGVNAAAKIVALVAGMVAGADSISDMDLLRHGGMGRLFDEVRAPSTLGTFLRLFTFGHIRQLDAGLALGTRARRTVRSLLARPRPRNGLTTRPTALNRRPQWKNRADRTITHAPKPGYYPQD